MVRMLCAVSVLVSALVKTTRHCENRHRSGTRGQGCRRHSRFRPLAFAHQGGDTADLEAVANREEGVAVVALNAARYSDDLSPGPDRKER